MRDQKNKLRSMLEKLSAIMKSEEKELVGKALKERSCKCDGVLDKLNLSVEELLIRR